MRTLSVGGRTIPEELVAELDDSAPLLDDTAALARRFDNAGYLFVRGLIPEAVVLDGRRFVLDRLAAVDEVRPGTDGLATGRSRRRELHPDLGGYWKSISEASPIRAVVHHPRLAELTGTLLRTAVVAHDYAFLRAASAGKATALHYDYPSFARRRLCTCWIPFGTVDLDEAPLAIVEGSHLFADLIDEIGSFDLSVARGRRSQTIDDVVAFVRERGTRLLTAAYRAGDVLLFGMHTLHGSLDNRSESGRVRLSCDIRYQPAADERDPRYFGLEPLGVTGGGYGELNGARPLTDAWHTR